VFLGSGSKNLSTQWKPNIRDKNTENPAILVPMFGLSRPQPALNQTGRTRIWENPNPCHPCLVRAEPGCTQSLKIQMLGICFRPQAETVLYGQEGLDLRFVGHLVWSRSKE